MTTTPTPVQQIVPRIYAHASRSEWGHAVISEEKIDRKTYFFENAGQRTFLNGSAVIVEMKLDPEERKALAVRITKRHAPEPGAPRDPKRRSVKLQQKAPRPTFDAQLALFAAAFPLGFVDPGLAQVEPGKSVPKAKGEGAVTRLAREVLSASTLRSALRNGGESDVIASAIRVLSTARALSLPKADVSVLLAIPVASHEAVARTLTELLHGQGDYAARFDAFVAAAGEIAWTIATVFPALVHPSEHFFVKPAMNQRQAQAIDGVEPPIGTPTGAAYAQHLAVALATRDRLASAGLAPRDLLDVYTFGWRTLTRAATAAPTRASA